jgi:type II secretory pathway pseudopilin PulG
MTRGAAQLDGRRSRAFTIIEVLVVIGVILLLLSILIVALGQATASAQKAKTRVLMTSIAQALVRFEEDIGYYPPVLRCPDDTCSDAGALRTYADPPVPAQSDYDEEVQSWYSVTALTDYLIGYGDEQEDGHGQPDDSNMPAPGIRTPGRDGVWGATLAAGGAYGTLSQRNVGGGPGGEGQVFGPYLDLGDQQLIASSDGTTDSDGNLRVFFPGEPGYSDDHPRVVVDHWGRPIRYYRRPYPRGAIGQPYRVGMAEELPTLSDFIILRPYAIPYGEMVKGWIKDQSPIEPDDGTTRTLQAGEFALFSSGPDKALNPLVRADAPEDFNKDNLVEVGP